ncbi:MAG: DUF3078 domain-containing protein [Bacteroides sp.]|nr:DUF3078 domain-containing protein [Bacteroides sp.]
MLRTFLSGLFLTVISLTQCFGQAVSPFGIPLTRSEIYNYIEPDTIYVDGLMILPDIFADTVPTDSLQFGPLPIDSLLNTMYVPTTPLEDYYFRPVVFDSFQLLDSLRLPLNEGDLSLNDAVFGWLATDNFHNNLIRRARQSFVVNRPDFVRYDEAHLPEPPKKFEAKVDPETAKIVIDELPVKEAPKKKMDEVKFERRHWLRTFTSSIQFSQAYVSPNWYQGGNNNINVLINLFYNIKLNPAFHKNLLFESTFQYKLGMNDAPNDSIRNYSISEDLFQWNLLAGYKASKYWYYSTNISFKTQFLNNYKANTRNLKGAFLSPGELNVGLGMTYNYANKKKTFTLDASISPLSWNMKTCINRRMNETSFDIKEGRKTVNQFGSNAEAKLYWAITENINLRSRLFMFTNYEYAYGDWENTLSFNINRFLTTQIYVHMRYDTTTPTNKDSDWRKFQLKEILSFGFAYKFSSI